MHQAEMARRHDLMERSRKRKFEQSFATSKKATEELRTELELAGVGSWFQQWDGLDEEHQPERWFEVFDRSGEGCAIINESKPCPPVCP